MKRMFLNNYEMVLKYAKIYLGVSIILFMIFGGDGSGDLLSRFLISAAVLGGYYLFFRFITWNTKLIQKMNKQNWETAKRTMRLQLSFQFYFFLVASLFILFGMVSNPGSFAFYLLGANLGFGIMLGSLHAERTYLE